MNVARPREVTELGLSKLGAVRLLRRDPIALLERAAAIGDLTHAVMPRTDVYFVNHPDDVWDVLATGNHDFHKSPALQNARRVLGDGLLTSEDETHRRQRRLIQPIFHHERIDTYGDPMVAEAERAADRWTDGAALDLHAEMARLTLAIVGRTLFATDVESAEAREVTGSPARDPVAVRPAVLAVVPHHRTPAAARHAAVRSRGRGVRSADLVVDRGAEGHRSAR